MSDVNDLARRLADLEAQASDIRVQIAARHGEVPREEVPPTQEPADKRQAELSEAARKRQSEASETVPAGGHETVDERNVDRNIPTPAPRKTEK